MAIVPYTTEAEWHALRAKTIGSSEVAALLNIEGAFTTRFQLWLEKSGKMKIPFEETERMRWGKKLEHVIAEGVAEQEGWELIKPEGYYLHPAVDGMGCTPDFLIKSPKHEGLGILEIKLIDYASFAKWKDDEPPLLYLVQHQQQFACTGYTWGAIAPMVNGNMLKVYPYERHEATIRMIEQAVAQFWQEVREDIEPKAVADDYEIVRDYYRMQEEIVVDLSGDNRFPELCHTAVDAAARRLAAEKEEKAAKAEILQKMANASYATCDGYSASRKEIISQMRAVEAHTRKSERLTIKEINQ